MKLGMSVEEMSGVKVENEPEVTAWLTETPFALK